MSKFHQKQEDMSINSESSISTPEEDHNSRKTNSLQKKTQDKKCPLCVKVYRSKYQAEIHQRTHVFPLSLINIYRQALSRFHAIFAKKDLTKKAILHVIFTFNRERPYQCTFALCNMKFKTKGQLTFHSNLHYNIRPYKCKICSAQFKRNERLKIHFLYHTGEKPYKCEVCEKTFNERGNMKSHRRNHEMPKVAAVHEETNNGENSIVHRNELSLIPKEKRSKTCLIEELLNKICSNAFHCESMKNN